MTAAGAIQERRVWFSGRRGWGVGAGLALLVAYATDAPSIQVSSNGGAIVYAEPWLTVLRAAAFLLLGAVTVGIGAYLATREPSEPSSRRVLTPRVLSWMAAFVVAALVVWCRDPIVNFLAGAGTERRDIAERSVATVDQACADARRLETVRAPLRLSWRLPVDTYVRCA
jgi:hypothetical protein